MQKVPEEIALLAVKKLREYKDTNKLSVTKLRIQAGVTTTTMSSWLAGKSRPRLSAIKQMIDAKMIAMELPEDLRQKAITATLREIDRGNQIPRKYRKRVTMPSLISNQIKLLVDDYVQSLDEPKTYAEFNESREEFINKLYYTCRQGE